MPPKLPDTPQSLLSELRNPNRGSNWQLSWERFLEIYYPALRTMCSNSYRLHSGGEEPPGEVIEDAVAAVIADFCTKSQYSYDPSKGKLRGFLKTICNARIVDHLRKEKRMLLHADMVIVRRFIDLLRILLWVWRSYAVRCPGAAGASVVTFTG